MITSSSFYQYKFLFLWSFLIFISISISLFLVILDFQQSRLDQVFLLFICIDICIRFLFLLHLCFSSKICDPHRMPLFVGIKLALSFGYLFIWFTDSCPYRNALTSFLFFLHTNRILFYFLWMCYRLYRMYQRSNYLEYI